MSDWKPALYLSFEKERTQPSIDLAARIDAENPRRVLDIGCGPGNSTQVLRRRWPGAEITGLDSSEAMLGQARDRYPEAKYPGIQWVRADATGDLSHLGLFDIVFSNAAIQWMPDHGRLLPGFFALLAPGGVLAVQVPCTKHMSLHGDLLGLAASPKWAAAFAALGPVHFVHEAAYYYDILSALSPDLALWQTEYYHVLEDHGAMVRWYSGTGLRPYLDCLAEESARADFLRDYEALLKASYRVRKNGKVLLPFTRIFFMIKKA